MIMTKRFGEWKISRHLNFIGLRGTVARTAVLGTLGCGLFACAQDPLVTLPNNYKLIFENQDVAVIRAHYAPHEKVPVHDHPSVSTVFVYLNNSGQVRIDHFDGMSADAKPESVVRPPTVEGAFRVSAGIAERHSIENLGDTSSDFLRVELKRVSLALKEPFRGKAPDTLARTADTVEFNEPDLEIERIVCVGSAPCPVKASAAPSLLIAFTPVETTRGSSSKKEHHGVGMVWWVNANEAASIAPPAGTAGQVLRILLPEQPRASLRLPGTSGDILTR